MSEQERFEDWYCHCFYIEDREAFIGLRKNGQGEYLQEYSMINTAWSAWQAATAQAVPEGCVVVPFKATPKIIHAIGIVRDEIRHMSHNTRNELIYDSMIKAAQEDE